MMSRQGPLRKRRFGLNYVPSKRWYYCWNDWNRDEIAEDFDAIASLGVDHLRVMTVWPFFQPNAGLISPGHLQRLSELMEEAGKRGLDVLLCPLTGWLSGFPFLPPDVGALDIFRSEEVFQRSTRYFEALLGVAGGRENFLGFDFGNEINVLVPDLPPAEGDAWGVKLAQWLRPKMGGKWLVNGVDHHPWFTGRTFSARHLVENYDAVTVHAWPYFTSALRRGGLADLPAEHLSAFLTHLCRHTMKQADVEVPVWIQEFGCTKTWGTEEEGAEYLRKSVENTVRAGATWITWWCSHDINPAYKFDPCEYDMGLITMDNKIKPLGEIYKDLIHDLANAEITVESLYQGFGDDFKPAITATLPPGQWLEQNLATTTWQKFDEYLKLEQDGW